MKLHFIGASNTVTGSCYYLETNALRLLIDCGLHQEKNAAPPTLPFEPASLDAVLLTHAHLDHSGLLPYLVANGFNGPIYSHHASLALCDVLLRDAENHQSDKQQPLYHFGDIQKTLALAHGLDYQQTIQLNNHVQFRLKDAGHIIGSSIIELRITENKQSKKLVFSGDLGHAGSPLLKAPSTIDDADIVIMESTYGNKTHRPWSDTFLQFKTLLAQAHREQGNVLIPAFAIGRTQDLLYLFQQHFKDWALEHFHIYLDSPMAVEATKVYAHFWQHYNDDVKRALKQTSSPYQLPNLRLVQSAKDSRLLASNAKQAIVIASSGMCQGGRIMHHLKQQLVKANTHVIFIGFQASGTLGRRLQAGNKTVTIDGESIAVKAKIHTLGGLSAHADQSHLIEWLRHFTSLKKVILTHGETKAKQQLKSAIEKQCHHLVLIPSDGDSLEC